MKKLDHKSIIGQKGANFTERVILEMKQIWRPTSTFDTGVDGLMEFRNPDTGAVENRQLQIQSKATESKWESETDAAFVFRVSEDDLGYWLRGNIPVILVVSRPDTNEGYWVSIRDYFSDPKRRTEKKVVFNKADDRFDLHCLTKLQVLGMATDRGIYRPPIRKAETLTCNLIPVTRMPATLYIADCSITEPKKLVDWLIEHKMPGQREWFLKGGRLHSVYGLEHPPWASICDRGTLEPFDANEWATSDDEDRQRDWVELLNRCLRQMLRNDAIRFQGEKQFRSYYFQPHSRKSGAEWEFNLTPDATQTLRYFSAGTRRKKKGRSVVIEILNKKDRSRLCYRHHAAVLRFYRFGLNWFLQISPTYYYSSDGEKASPLHEYQLAGMKRLERNNAVAGHLKLWESALQDRADMYRSPYSWLGFGKLSYFNVDQGIPDEQWKPIADDEVTTAEGELF